MTETHSMSKQLEAGPYFKTLKEFFDVGAGVFQLGGELVAKIEPKALPENYEKRLEETHIVLQSSLLRRSRDTFKTILLAVSSGCCSDAQALFRSLFEQYLDMMLLQQDPANYTEALLFYDYVTLVKGLDTKRKWTKTHSCAEGFLGHLEKDENELRRKCQEVKTHRKKKLRTKNHQNWSGLSAFDRLCRISEPTGEKALFSEFFFAWHLGSQFVHPSGMAAGKYYEGGVGEPLSLKEYQDETHLQFVLVRAINRHLGQIAILDALVGNSLGQRILELDKQHEKAYTAAKGKDTSNGTESL